MYLTFDEFQSYGGTLDETTFNDYEYTAETIVDWHTFNRLHGEEDIPERVKRLMYHLIGLIKSKSDLVNGASVSQIGIGAIASQSNDGVSTSYNVLRADLAIEVVNKEYTQVVNQYLNGVQNSVGRLLLYRGIYPGE